MKNFKRLLNFGGYILLFVVGGLAACSGSDDIPSEEQYFKLTSNELDCSSGKTTRVPYAGKTYVIKVEASNEVEWNAKVVAGNLLSLSPEGTQKGNGQIEIIATASSDRTEVRTGSVSIHNSFTNTEMKISFEQKEKDLFFPEGTEGQTSADFTIPTSKYNIYYMEEGVNVAILWDRSLGIVPTKFDSKKAIKAADDCFDFLVDEVGFANRTTSYANKYKFLIFINKEDQWTAYGGGNHNVGMIWLGPNHLSGSEKVDRYGIYYHEMCHCFQAMSGWDGAAPMNGPLNEMTSQWALLRRYPNWMELEPHHINNFLLQTHYAFGHEENGYRSPWLLEYWENKRGPQFTPRIWKDAIASDNADPVVAYKRLTGLNQEQFNDDTFDAYRHFITWDIPSIKETSVNYANKHTCKLTQASKTYRITPEKCPQNYGYNGIKLQVPAAGTTISLAFNGFTVGGNEFYVPYPNECGWRYGFVAMKKNGERVYGDMGKEQSGQLSFKVPENTTHLWLVVMGAPTNHRKHVINQAEPDATKRKYAQWPYQFTLLNAELDETMIQK